MITLPGPDAPDLALYLLLGLDALDLAPLAYVFSSACVSDRTDLDVVLGLLPESLELE